MARKITIFFGISVMFAVFFGGLTFSQSAIADRQGDEAGLSNCDECFAVVNANLESCGLDMECQNKELTAFGDCTLTCEGDLFQVFPEDCVHKASPTMSECSATNLEEINQCAVEWNFILEECSIPG